MMRDFYSSPAVLSNGSDEIFSSDFDSCINDGTYIEGYIFETDGTASGYSMVAKSFSTEFGKRCIWIEDLYIKPEFRGLGIGSAFLEFITKKYPECVFRLEVEDENETAIGVYRKFGFEFIDYKEMIKNEAR